MVSAGQGGDATLIRTGAHKITVGSQVVGFTHGNLTLTFAVNKRTVNVNEFGTTPVDEVVTGLTITVKFAMIERSLKVFDIAFNGLYPSNQFTATTSRGLGRSGVYKAQDVGKEITLHPISKGSADTSEDIVLHKVMLTPTGSWTLDETNEQILEVEGMCVVDLAQADGALLALINEANAGA